MTYSDAMKIPHNRIASIEILKGQIAVRLYGPRAANGVVLVHTKKNP